ncbi:MAG: UDP-glucose 4-epimerase, partial [uncultured Acetobacteraceae bacterium]
AHLDDRPPRLHRHRGGPDVPGQGPRGGGPRHRPLPRMHLRARDRPGGGDREPGRGHPGRDAGPPHRLRRGGAPRRAVQRSPGRHRPGPNPGTQHGRGRRPRPRREAGGRAALPLLLFLQQLRRGGAGLHRRGRGVPPRDALRPLQSGGGGRTRAAGGRAVLAGADALLHRLRRFAPAPLRLGGQQPDGLRGGDRRHLPEERRQPLAGDRPHRGHRARLPRGVRGAAREGAHAGLQRRLHRRELPRHRDRAHGGGGGARLPHPLRAERRARPALLPRELRQAGPDLARCADAVDRAAGRRAALRRLLPPRRPSGGVRGAALRARAARPLPDRGGAPHAGAALGPTASRRRRAEGRM